MHSSAVFGAWETAPPVPVPCSYLYSLPSIGVGTAAVESFTGYLTRLAAAHAVETGVLVNTELLPRVPRTKGASIAGTPSKMPTSFFIDAFPLNGIGERARAWVCVLERMTGIRGLDLLTLLPWSKTISCVHLLRTYRAWCPYCYGNPLGLANQQVYDRLLWTFQVVTACPVHRYPLESICPSCTKEQYVFAPRMRPGYCSRCQAWLGRAPQPSINDRSESVRIAEMVGELLAASPRLSSGIGLDRFRENIRTFRRCRQVHVIVEGGNIRGWMKGNVPRMDSLVLLSLHQNTSMLDLLMEPIVVEPCVTSHPAHAHYRVDGSTVEAALQATLREDVPSSLAEIATRLGYLSAKPLKFRFHDLCQAIRRKRHANLKLSSAPVTVPIPRERIEQALSEALLKDGPISLSSLAKSIGLHNKRRLYKGFRDLRKAVIANNREHRRQLGAAIESTLRAALEETPVPSLNDIARRLGLKSTSALTRCFSDLSTELKRRRRAELDNGQLSSHTSRPVNLPMIAIVSGLPVLADASNSPQ